MITKEEITVHDQSIGLKGFPQATPHEAAVISLLSAAQDDEQLAPEARALAGRAVRTWHHGHQLRGALYVLPLDATARLGAIRARLLVDLAALAPASAPPLEALHALGDPSPQGWCVALQVALGRARTPLPRPPRRPAAAPEGDAPGTWGEAVTALANDPDAAAPSLESVVAHGGELHLMLGSERAHPQVGLRLHSDSGPRSEWREVQRETWSAAAALVATLHAAPCLGIPQAHAAWVGRTLRETLAELLAGQRSDRDAIERVLAEWGRASVRPARSQRWGWPGTFAPLLAAADRLAGSGAGLPLAAAPVPGAWLEQIGSGGVVVAAGRVLERSPARGRRGRRGSHRREAGVPMEIGGERREVPLAELRLPRHAPLFPDRNRAPLT